MIQLMALNGKVIHAINNCVFLCVLVYVHDLPALWKDVYQFIVDVRAPLVFHLKYVRVDAVKIV